MITVKYQFSFISPSDFILIHNKYIFYDIFYPTDFILIHKKAKKSSLC